MRAAPHHIYSGRCARGLLAHPFYCLSAKPHKHEGYMDTTCSLDWGVGGALSTMYERIIRSSAISLPVIPEKKHHERVPDFHFGSAYTQLAA